MLDTGMKFRVLGGRGKGKANDGGRALDGKIEFLLGFRVRV